MNIEVVRRVVLWCTEEADEWLLRAVADSPSQINIMYGLAGERRLTEFEEGRRQNPEAVDALGLFSQGVREIL